MGQQTDRRTAVVIELLPQLKNDEGGNIQTTPSDINNWEQIALIEDLADKNESFQEYDGVKPHTDDGNMIDESPQTVDIGGITEASLVGQNNGRKLLEILNEGMGDIVEDKKPHKIKIDGNMKDKKMAPSIEASLVEQNDGGKLLDMEKLMELLNEG